MTRNMRMTKKEKMNWLIDIAEGFRPLDLRASKFVRSLLDDPDPQVRAEAVACLWNSADPSWIDVLINKAENDPDLDVRTRSISALGHYLYEQDTDFEDDRLEYEGFLSERDLERVVTFLFATAQDPEADPDERRYSIESLAFLDDPEVDTLIEWAFGQKDSRYRISALFAMGRTGDLRWTEEVMGELHSDNREIQYEAVRAAGELGLREASEELIALAQGRGVEKSLRLVAIYALGHAGDERAYPVLEELCHARDRDIRDAAREAAEEWLIASTEEETDGSDDDGIWPDDAEPEDYDDNFGKDIWDNVLGSFSLN